MGEINSAFGQKFTKFVITYKSLLSSYKKNLLFGAMLLFTTNIISATLPRFINLGVNLIEKNQPQQMSLFIYSFTFSSIRQIIFYIFMLAILGFFIRTQSRVVLFNIGRYIEKNLRSKIFDHLLVMDDFFYKKFSVGELMNYLTTDITNARLFSGFAMLNIINLFFVFLTTVPFLFSINTVLAFLALLPFPLVILATSGITQRLYLQTKEYQKILGSLQEHVQESLSAAQIVRLFHNQDFEESRFAVINEQNFIASMKLAKVRVLLYPIMRMVIGVCLFIILLIGIKFIVSNKITLGDFVEINARILQLTWPAMSVGFVLSIYQRGRASLFRINDLLERRPEILDGSIDISNIHKIEVKNFSLKIGDSFELKNISFVAEKGKVLAIAGLTGSGKSTLIRAICRRIPVEQGSILIDKFDINNIFLKSFNENLSIANNEPFLFNTTIRENVLLGNPVSNIEFEQVIKDVKLYDEIAKMSDGVNTVIGERGILLSGGQRQRLGLARALLLKRPVLILDDALTAVDIETENFIWTNLLKRSPYQLIIIVTNRPQLLMKADEILFMDQGKIRLRGRHDDLLRNDDLYSRLIGISYE